jgi:hypothetical protein
MASAIPNGAATNRVSFQKGPSIDPHSSNRVSIKGIVEALTAKTVQGFSQGPDGTLVLSSANEVVVYDKNGKLLWKHCLDGKGGWSLADPMCDFVVHIENHGSQLSIRNLKDGSLRVQASINIDSSPWQPFFLSAVYRKVYVTIVDKGKSFIACYDDNLRKLWQYPLDSSTVKVLHDQDFLFIIKSEKICCLNSNGTNLRDISLGKESCKEAVLISSHQKILLGLSDDFSALNFFRLYDIKKSTFSDCFYSPFLELASTKVIHTSPAEFYLLCVGSPIPNAQGLLEYPLMEFDSSLNLVWKYTSPEKPHHMVIAENGNVMVSFSPASRQEYDTYQRVSPRSLSYIKEFNPKGQETLHYDMEAPLFSPLILGQDGIVYFVIEGKLYTLEKNMAMAVATETIGIYHYMHGAGSQNNRQIVFQRNIGRPETLHAIISAQTPEGWRLISDVLGREINVKMLSTSDKVSQLQAQRMGQKVENDEPDKKLSALSKEEQDDILKKLNPLGSWRIEIATDIGSNPHFENVIRLNLYNPG